MLQTNQTYLGQKIQGSDRQSFYLTEEDRRRHLYVVGQTGTGKGQFQVDLLEQDLAKGYGVCLLDPHGEIIDDILYYIPENRVDDVILLDEESFFSQEIDLLDIIINQKILLINAKEADQRKIGDYIFPRLRNLIENGSLIGKLAEPFNFYIDEYQNFATDDFALVLSEARPQRLIFNLASYELSGDLPEPVKLALFGNISTIVILKVSHEDSIFWEKEVSPHFDAKFLANQPKFQAVVKTIAGDGHLNSFVLDIEKEDYAGYLQAREKHKHVRDRITENLAEQKV
jgi:hypothetical protein